MNKRGQITIFIIIGIVIIAAVIIFMNLRNNNSPDKNIIIENSPQVYLFVQTCFENSAKESIFQIGKYGGYALPPIKSTESKIPYYYFDGQDLTPSKQEIKEELELLTQIKIDICLRNFKDLPEFQIEKENSKVDAFIKDDYITFKLKLPLSIQSKNITKYTIDDFGEIEIQSKLLQAFELTKIINSNLPEGINIGNALNEAIKNEFQIQSNDYDSNITIFIIKDVEIDLNEKEFEWKFANKYG